jgi:predicted aspartyl protease
MSQTMTDDTRFTLTGGKAPLVLVPTYVNEQGPHNFILDTGAAYSAISPELASRLGIDAESSEQGSGAGGAVQMSLARASSMSVGSARQMNAQLFISNDLEACGAGLKAQVDGLIGVSFLKDFRVTIDYGQNVLRLERGSEGWTANTDGTAPMPFTLAAATPIIVVQAAVNGQGPFAFCLDTGAGRTVLSPELAERLDIRNTEATRGAGVGGEMQITRATVDSVSLGEAVVQRHIVIIGAFMEAISAAAGTKLYGIIGHNFLNQFQVTIDYPQNRLTLVVPRKL